MKKQKSINVHHFIAFPTVNSIFDFFAAEEYNGRSFTILYFCLLIDFAFEDGTKKKYNF